MQSSFEKRWSLRDQVAATPFAPGLFLALAPMDGVTDVTYRSLITSLSPNGAGISQCVSEFVRVTNQRVPKHVITRHCPEVLRNGTTESGVPVFVQILGSSIQWMAQAALDAVEMGAPGVDINFGCPAKTVNSSDGGATLLKNPCRVEEVTKAVRKAVPDKIPVTAKIRIGWDSGEQIEEISRAAENGGASWLTIHARTRKQLYKPPVHWDVLAKAVECVRIPVIANGDLFSPDAIRKCAKISNCDAFMLGRGVMGQPNLFEQIRNERKGMLSMLELGLAVMRYATMLLEAGASERNALGRVKQWLRMGAACREDLVDAFDEIKRIGSLTEALKKVERGMVRGQSLLQS